MSRQSLGKSTALEERMDSEPWRRPSDEIEATEGRHQGRQQEAMML